MPYEPVEDILGIDNASINAQQSDDLMRTTIRSTQFTLKHPSNLIKGSDYKREMATLLHHQLLMYSITHVSIREIVKVAVRHKQYPLVGDALSLSREQVEKVFIIATLLDSPNISFRKYLRSIWKTDYQAFLLELEEQAENERFDEFLTKTAPKRIEDLRRPYTSKGRREVIVSKFAKRALRHTWDNPGDQKPEWFVRTQKQKKKGRNRYGRIQDYVRDYFDFATPGRSVTRFKDPNIRKFLFRWHKEYTFLSQYTHVSLGKLMFADMHLKKDLKSQDAIKEKATTLAIRSIHTSYTAAATSCALIVAGVSNDYGAKEQLNDWWVQLTSFSLFSKALWNMHIESLFK